MKSVFPKLAISLAILNLTACGGGSSEESEKVTTPPPINQAPVISATNSIVSEANSSAIERNDNFIVLLTITDNDGDSISGTAELGDVEVNLEEYSGGLNFTHQASFVAPEAGDYTVSVKATDGKAASTTSNIGLSVLPNSEDVITYLENSVSGFISGGSYEGTELLGISTNANNVNFGYLDTQLNDKQLAQNESPYGVCGSSVPHKLLKVQKDTSGVTLPSSGVVYPMECFTNTQAQSINKKLLKAQTVVSSYSSAASNLEYTAQNITITIETSVDGTSASSVSTGSGIILEGNMHDVICGNYTLSKTNATYLLNADEIVNDIDELIDGNNKFTLECSRTVEFEGATFNSGLIGKISGEKVIIDSLDPVGSINGISFSVPYDNGGLDVGSICVSTTVEDNSSYVKEALELTSSDGLAKNIAFGQKNDANQYCLELSSTEGSYHVTQTVTDGSGNSVVNQSQSYEIVKNQAPKFSVEVPSSISLNTNQGIITLIEQSDISDPEGHIVTLSGQTSIDTDQAEGEYVIVAYATDEFGAESEKLITVTLSKLQIPPTVDAGSNVVANEKQQVTLTGVATDSDGEIVSVEWTQVSGNEVTLSSTNTEVTSFIAPEVSEEITLLFQFTARDNENNENSDTVSVKVSNVNVFPTVNAGQDFEVDEGQVVTLTGAANDSDGEVIGVKWTQLSGTNVELSDSSSMSTTFVAPTVEQNEELSFELSVTDNDGNMSSDEISIQINNVNSLPIADAGPNQSINTGTTLQLDGTSSYDDDRDQLTYIWSLDSKPFTSFASLSNATTATPSIKVDKAGEYLISLVVNDGTEDSVPSSITLTVVEGVNPISENIDLIIVAGHKYHGFSGTNYREVLQAQTTACWYVGALDIDEEGILYSVSSYQPNGIRAVDPSQPLCIEQGPQPRSMRGLAIDSNGKLWGTSDLITSGNLKTKLYHLEKDGTVLSELDFSGHEDVIFGIDYSSDGTLYGIGFTSRQLVTINTVTGVTTFVATIAPNINVQDIDINSNDVLRVLDGDTGDLYELNLNGEQLNRTNIPSLCKSCGRVSIATNK
jgi:hypothetical protein